MDKDKLKVLILFMLLQNQGNSIKSTVAIIKSCTGIGGFNKNLCQRQVEHSNLQIAISELKSSGLIFRLRIDNDVYDETHSFDDSIYYYNCTIQGRRVVTDLESLGATNISKISDITDEMVKVLRIASGETIDVLDTHDLV